MISFKTNLPDLIFRKKIDYCVIVVVLVFDSAVIMPGINLPR